VRNNACRGPGREIRQRIARQRHCFLDATSLVQLK
jgi:hypothetical protein